MTRFSIADCRLPIGKLSLFILVLGLGVVAAPAPSDAQQPGKVPRIGFLGASSESDLGARFEAFRQRLRDLGYVEGKTLIVESRWAEGRYERLPALAAELVGLPVDLIVTHGTPGARAAKRATTTIPIVMAASGDAVASGLVTSLARSGGNITGSTFFSPEVTAKRLELLKEAVPLLRRVAVLLNPDDPGTAAILRAMALTATSLNVALEHFEARGPIEFESVFTAMATRRIDALATTNDTTLITNAARLAALAVQRRLPSVGFTELAQAGGLLGYGVDFPELFRRAAVFVDKTLKGATPADLPVEQPTKFDLAINLKTAKALALTIPQSLLMRADEVIE
jgi:putative ABC transport system substrate-binding protein